MCMYVYVCMHACMNGGMCVCYALLCYAMICFAMLRYVMYV